GGRTHLFLSPLFHVLSLAAFELRGPTITSARMISALAGTASIPLLYLLVRDLSGDRELASFASALFALDQFYMFTARLAQIEAVELAILLGMAWLAVRGGRAAPLLSGLCAGLALLTKINAAIVVAVIGLTWLLAGFATRDAASARISR